MLEQRVPAASESGSVTLTRLPPSEMIEEKRVQFFDGLRRGGGQCAQPRPETVRPDILSVEWEQQLGSCGAGQQQQQRKVVAQAPLAPLRRVPAQKESRPLCNYFKHQRRAQQLRAAGEVPAFVTSSSPYIDPFRAQLNVERSADARAKAMHGSPFKPAGHRDEWRAFLATAGFAASSATDSRGASAKSSVRVAKAAPHGRRSCVRWGEAGLVETDHNGRPQRF
eukprot:scaffold13602_cov131-Isochrysis_galbana.AAC.3